MDGLIERAATEFGVLVAVLMIAVVWLAWQLRQALKIISYQNEHVRKQSDTLLVLMAGSRGSSASPVPSGKPGE